MKETSKGFSEVKSILISVAAAFLTGVLLLLLFSAVAYSADDPNGMILQFSRAALAVSSLVCGIFAVRMSELGAVSGAFSGAALALLLFLLSALRISALFSSGAVEKIIIYAAVVAVSTLGALIGHKRGGKSKNYRKRIKSKRR